MKRAQRILAAGLGAAAIALGAVALAAPAAAAPGPAPSTPSTSSSPASPSSAPSPSVSSSGAPSASPSTPDKPSTGTKRAAPKAAVYDMELVASTDVTFVSNGPGNGITSSVNMSVHNAGTVAQQGLTVTVEAPSNTHLTGTLVDPVGIDGCVRGTTPTGYEKLTCRVHDGGPGAYERAGFGITGDVPLPPNPRQPYGSVTLNGYHQPNANPGGTEVVFQVHGIDTSKPTETMDLLTTAPPVWMSRGTDGRYHGTLWTSVTNRGSNAVPPMTLEVLPPKGVTVDSTADGGLPYPCFRPREEQYGSGFSCLIEQAPRPGQTFTVQWKLSADEPTAKGALGLVSAIVVGDHSYRDPENANTIEYGVNFDPTATGASASASPSTGGQAAGSGSSLPVTGTPLALIAGGGAAVLAAGGALLVLSRRRRVQSPKI